MLAKPYGKTTLLAGVALMLAPRAGLAQGALELTTAAQSVNTVRVSAEPYLLRFTVTQHEADSGTYHLACAGVGAAQCLTSPEPLTLAPGEERVIEVTYRATRPG